VSKLLSIKTYARKAYKNRYAFDSVTVDKAGKISGHWAQRGQALAPSDLGSIADCRTVKTDTGVRFYNRDFLVYTFGLPA